MCVQKAVTWQSRVQGYEKGGGGRRSVVEDQCCTVFRKSISAPNREVAVEPKRRKMVWTERPNFQGWACTECAWIFNPTGALVGESIEFMKRRNRASKEWQICTAGRVEPIRCRSNNVKCQASCPASREKALNLPEGISLHYPPRFAQRAGASPARVLLRGATQNLLTYPAWG
jgi:hypothetical protein